MSAAALIIGASGMGKSTSMRNMNPADTLLIQPVRKLLPFPNAHEWKIFNPETKTGNILILDDPEKILSVIQKTSKKRIVLDDYQFVLINEFMRRSKEKGYDKFTEIAFNSWQIMLKAHELAEDKTVFFMWHPEEDEHGNVRAKTVGKLLDRHFEPHSTFSICFMAVKQDGKHYFQTQSNGTDPAKSPIGMFEDQYIDNDLNAIDTRIREYLKMAV